MGLQESDEVVEPPAGSVHERIDPDVREAQFLLQDYAESLQTDGVAGSETANALRRFQAEAGLSTDGVLDAQTKVQLRERLGHKRDRSLLDVRGQSALGLLRLGIRGEVLIIGTNEGRIFEYRGFPPQLTIISQFEGSYRDFDIGPRFALLTPTNSHTALVVNEAWGIERQIRADPSAIVRLSAAGRAAVGGDRLVSLWPVSGDPVLFGEALDPVGMLWTEQEELLICTSYGLWLVKPDGSVRARATLNDGEGSGDHCELAVTTDGLRVALAVRDAVLLFQGSDLSVTGRIRCDQRPLSIAFDRSGERLFVGATSGRVGMFDPDSGAQLKSWRAHSGNVISIATLDNDARLATLGREGALKLWALGSPAGARRITILKSDLEHGKDALNLDRDVRAFAQLIMAKGLTPPLSIGVFGDWGSGKSFFIQELQEEIHRHKLRAQKAEERQLSCAWHGHVEQITFNAWHYAETNLWAALVTHLFDELGKLVNPSEDPTQTRKRLLGDLETARAAKQEATERENVAQKELDEAQVTAKAVGRELEAARTVANQLDASKLLQLISTDLWDKYGSNEIGAIASQWQKRIMSLRSSRGRLLAALCTLASARNLFVSIVIALLGAALTLYFLGLQRFEFAVWKALVAPFGVAAYWVKRVNDLIASPIDAALGWLGSNGPKFDQMIERWKKGTAASAELSAAPLSIVQAEAHAHVENLNASLNHARQASQRADEAIAAARRALEDAGTGRVLYDFLAKRASSTEYRMHLGVVSLIRSDLERLSALVGVTQSSDSHSGIKQIARIDRIVLYVDDLDRCAPDRVVEVLQAVHVLLAMKLFVVVVAVDSRWLISSVSDHYRKLLGASPSKERLHGELTPLNYLEKIFQIPYLVPAIGDDGFARMLEELVPIDTFERTPDERFEHNIVDGPLAAKIEERPDARAPTGQTFLPSTNGAVPAFSESETPQAGAPQFEAAEPLELPTLLLSKSERDFMERLHPLIRTPRAAKTFVNVYKVFRSALARPLPGEPNLRDYLEKKLYPTPMLLLALQVGDPRLAESFQRSVLAQRETLDSCLLELREHFKSGAQFDVLPQSLDDVARGKRALQLIAELRADQDGDAAILTSDLSVFREWIPRTRRFSFSQWGRMGLAEAKTAH